VNGIAPKLHDDRPKLVAFGGGKGGIGRSTLTAEISRALARRGHRVLCVDADWSAPTLNTLLNVEEPTAPADPAPPLEQADAHVADYITDTGFEDVWLLSFAIARQDPFSRPVFRPLELIRQMHQLTFDWVLIDLPPGLDPLDVDLFVLSDIPILVSSPEPAAVRVSTQFLRCAICRAIGYHPDTGEIAADLEDTLEVQPLEADRDTLLEAAPSDPAKRLVRETFDRLETYLLVNLVREGAEKDLGHVLCHAWHRAIGLFPRFLTPVDYEDRRWFYHRRTSGSGAVRGDETLSRDIEIVARSLKDIDSIDQQYPRPIPDDTEVHPAVQLGLSPDESVSKIRQFCRQLWEGYGRENTVDLIFSDEEARQHVADNLQSLYREVLTLNGGSTGGRDTTPGIAGQTATPSSRPTLGEQSSSPTTSSHTPASRSTPTDLDRPAPESTEHESPDAAGSTEADDSDTVASEDASTDGDASTPADTSADGRDRTATPSDATTASDPADQTNPPTTDKDNPSERSLQTLGLDDITRPGRLVERLRRDHEVGLHELSVSTQIGAEYLAALEDARLDDLPRPVYTRGYLRQIARQFDADPDELVARYFELLDDPPDDN
jgi:flagellar biosynthesis protein FlhG